jgi:hypothetical protein
MKREIPYKILVLKGQDVKLEEGLRDFMITELCYPRTTSKKVLEGRKTRLSARYECGTMEAIELENTGFTLELVSWDQFSRSYFNDCVPIIIHHPDLPENINYSTCIVVSRYWLLENLLKNQSIINRKLLGTYCFDIGGKPYLEDEHDLELTENKAYGKLLGDKNSWTKNYIPGHKYYILDGVSYVRDAIYMGQFNLVWDKRYNHPPTSPYNSYNCEYLTRLPAHVFRIIGWGDTITTKSEFFDANSYIEAYPISRKKNAIDLGEHYLVDANLPSLLTDEEELFSECLNCSSSEYAGLVSGDYLKKNQEAFINYLRKIMPDLRRLDKTLRNKDIIDLSEDEIKNIESRC